MSSTAVREKPIIFSGAMVRAILDGRKSQTRRIVKLRDPSQTYSVFDDDGWPVSADECGDWNRDPCPHGSVGSRLWVREKWQQIAERIDGQRFVVPQPTKNVGRFLYAATLTEEPPPRWRSPIHMPRWASRITLEITDVRVERLASINWLDASAEGVGPPPGRHHVDSPETDADREACMTAFRELWESIHGKGSWQASPWVWCISFRRLDSQ